MAAVASLPQSAHLLGSNAYPAFHHHNQYHQHPRLGHQQSGFNAFHHHHGSPRSPASSTSSWREHAPTPAPASRPTAAFAPRKRSASPSWRNVPVNTSVPSVRTRTPSPAAHGARVYSIDELLRLASSPLVGVSPKKQAVLADITEHWVWRRGAHTKPKRSGRSRSPRSTSPSTRSSSEESS